MHLSDEIDLVGADQVEPAVGAVGQHQELSQLAQHQRILHQQGPCCHGGRGGDAGGEGIGDGHAGLRHGGPKQLGEELEVTEPYTFSSMMESMDEENEERSEQLDEEGEIYGLTSYD